MVGDIIPGAVDKFEVIDFPVSMQLGWNSFQYIRPVHTWLFFGWREFDLTSFWY